MRLRSPIASPSPTSPAFPPLVSQSAFDAVRQSRAQSRRPARWVVADATGRLELRGDGRVSPPPRPCYWSYRAVPGRIRSSRWHPSIPVRLELVPWSDTRAALGLHLAGHPLPYLDEDIYLQVGLRTLEILAAELEAWPLQELTALEHSFRHRRQSGWRSP